jgi:DNA-directed RNA polymerase subunit omega
LIKPEIEDLLSKTDNKFAMVMGVARRIRQITDFLSAMGKGELIKEEGLAPPMVEAVREKPLQVALTELAQGKINIEYVTEEKRRARAEEIPPALRLTGKGIKEEPEFKPEVEVEGKAKDKEVVEEIEEIEEVKGMEEAEKVKEKGETEVKEKKEAKEKTEVKKKKEKKEKVAKKVGKEKKKK